MCRSAIGLSDIVVHQRAVPKIVGGRSQEGHQTISRWTTIGTRLKALTDPHLWFAYWIGVAS